MFRSSSDAKPVLMADGIARRTLTHGAKMILVEFSIRAGAVFPEHHHVYEQIGYLCSGKGRLWIGPEARDLRPGSSWCVPENVPHRAEFFEDSIAIDIFSPVREDYLPPSSDRE
ncbi:MAG: cupin domain-containing protein [bacterium]